MKKYWFIIPVILVALVGIGSYQLESILSKETTTTLTTPTLGSLCSTGYYLQGYDSNGSIVCNPFPISNNNNTSYSKLLLWAKHTTSEFKTNSTIAVPTLYPENNNFTKLYNDSYIRISITLDFLNTKSGTINNIKICTDNCTYRTIWSNEINIPNRVHTETFTTIIPGKHIIGWGACDTCIGAGSHTLKMYVYVSNGTGTFETNAGMLAVEEFYP